MLPLFLFLLSGAFCLEPEPEAFDLKEWLREHHPKRVMTMINRVQDRTPRFMAAHHSEPLSDPNLLPPCGCRAEDTFLLHHFFESNDKPVVDFFPHVEYPAAESDISISEATAIVRTNSSAWSTGATMGVELSGKAFGIGVAATEGNNIEYTYQSGHEHWVTQTVSRSFECPPNHLCELQTWSFTTEYPGTYYQMPAVDFKGYPDIPGGIRWRFENTETYHQLNQSSKAAFASLAGKVPAWDEIGKQYYTVTDKNTDEDIREVPPGGRKMHGLDWPPDTVKVNLKQSKSGSVTIPYREENVVYSALMLIKTDLGDRRRKRHEAARGSGIRPESTESEIFILETNIPGLEADPLPEQMRKVASQ